jgi:hypothetical protein
MSNITDFAEANHDHRTLVAGGRCLACDVLELAEYVSAHTLLQQEEKAAAEKARDALEAGLVRLYRDCPATVAAVCDKWIDKSGALLGRVRAASRKGEGK